MVYFDLQNFDEKKIKKLTENKNYINFKRK